jgi:hypothetical protein
MVEILLGVGIFMIVFGFSSGIFSVFKLDFVDLELTF